jgi:hypothetical protein
MNGYEGKLEEAWSNFIGMSPPSRTDPQAVNPRVRIIRIEVMKSGILMVTFIDSSMPFDLQDIDRIRKDAELGVRLSC